MILRGLCVFCHIVQVFAKDYFNEQMPRPGIRPDDPRGVYAIGAGGGNLPPQVPKKQKAVYTRIYTERNGKSGVKQGEKV